MSMELVRKRRTREIPGHTPNAVGIIARPTLKRPPDSLILENRKKEDLCFKVEAEQKEAQKLIFKNEWEISSTKRIKQATVNRRVEGILQHDQYHLEARRERLRDMLADEERQYAAELEASQETTVERQAKMRDRAHMLREKREAERKALAQEKYDQRWRLECEELRSTMSQRNTDLVCRERDSQLREKEFIREQDQEEERMFADLWAADHRLKAQREEAEGVAQLERNKEMVKTLNLQKAALEEQKRQEQVLRDQEKQFVEEQIALRKMEDEHRQRDRLRMQKERQRELTRNIKQKMKLRAKEVQEELALDIKLLQQLLLETQNEASEAVQDKKRRHDEMMQYMQYLQDDAKREKQREIELSRMLQHELDKDYAKVVDKWRQEQAARARLLREVMETRQQQIAEKIERNRIEQEEAQVESIRLNEIFQEHIRLEKEEEAQRKRARKRHQSDLLEQLDYQTALKEEEDHMEKLALVDIKKQEESYKAKLQHELGKELFAGQRHPIRKAMAQSGRVGGTFNF